MACVGDGERDYVAAARALGQLATAATAADRANALGAAKAESALEPWLRSALAIWGRGHAGGGSLRELTGAMITHGDFYISPQSFGAALSPAAFWRLAHSAALYSPMATCLRRARWVFLLFLAGHCLRSRCSCVCVHAVFFLLLFLACHSQRTSRFDAFLLLCSCEV